MTSDIISSDLLKVLQTKYGIIGESEAILESMEKLVMASPTDLTVLITGETGTGKEVFANAIHGLSTRRKYPFISVNCGAIPETLLESELFGHEKGAFTGATDQRKGYFEVADKGTIFLDEIGEMPYGTQVKLLRVLESGEFTRLGSTTQRKVDVRVITATNRDLAQEVTDGKFRQDLYFRLNNVHIILPPIRNHPEDIPLLVKHFAKKTCEKLGLQFDGIASDALQMLKVLPWPGNIRELRNLIETMITLEQETFITSHILQRYIPKALPPRSFNPLPQESAIVPLSNPDASQAFGMEIIFRTLLELKQDSNEIKRMIHTLANQIESLKVNILSEQTASYQAVNETLEDDMNLTELEKKMINLAIKKNNGNRRSTAKDLGISERTLYRKLTEYGIE